MKSEALRCVRYHRTGSSLDLPLFHGMRKVTQEKKPESEGCEKKKLACLDALSAVEMLFEDPFQSRVDIIGES